MSEAPDPGSSICRILLEQNCLNKREQVIDDPPGTQMQKGITYVKPWETRRGELSSCAEGAIALYPHFKTLLGRFGK